MTSKFQNILLIVFLIIGSIYTFLLPPFQVPDEQAHWSFSQKQFEKIFNFSHSSIAHDLRDVFDPLAYANNPAAKWKTGVYEKITNGDLPTTKSPISDISYGNILLYPGTLLSSFLFITHTNDYGSILQKFFLSRLLGGLFIFAVLLRIAQLSYKNRHDLYFFCLLPICLSPIFIQQSFAVTADTTVLMFALIFSAYLTLGESFEKVDFTLLVITGLLTTLSKIPYSPLLLLPACFSLLEKTRIQKRDKLLVLILISSGAIGFIQYLINLNQKSGNQPYSYQTQLDFILNHPFETFKKLSIENIKYLTHIPLFSHLGWMDVPLTKMTRPLLALLFIITITPLFRRIKLKFNKTYLTQQFTRISLFMIFVFISSMLFSLAIFVTFRPGGQYIFSGLQLRYYLPFWIIATAFVPKIKIEITKTFLVPCVFISALYIAYTVMPLLVRYY